LGGGLALSGVTLNGTTDVAGLGNVPSGVAVSGGLTVNGTLNLFQGDIFPGSFGYLRFDSSQTLGGSGKVHFGNNNGNNALWLPNAGTALTIAPGFTVDGASGFIGAGLGGSGNVVVLNEGTVEASGGGAITVSGTGWRNGGPDPSNPAVVDTGLIEATGGGGLSFQGSWSNTFSGGGQTRNGQVTVGSGSSLTLAGSFAPADLGHYTSSGSVFLTGTFNNAGNNLVLDNTPGSPTQVASWTLAGG